VFSMPESVHGLVGPARGRSTTVRGTETAGRSALAVCSPFGDGSNLAIRFSAKRACVVVTDSKPDGFAPLPASARGPLRGLGGGGAMLRRHKGEEFCMYLDGSC
jgi:hypothetical protein